MTRLLKSRFFRIPLIVFVLAVLVLPSIPLFHFDVPVRAAPPDAYWVLGSGNWSDAAGHWAAASGGAPGAGNLPDATTNVHFDASSGFGIGDKTVTITGGTAYCNDMDWTGAPNNPILAWSGGVGLEVSGTVILITGMTTTSSGSGEFAFVATGAENVTTNGVTIAPRMVFNGTGGSWTLQDTLTINNSNDTANYSLRLTAGTLNTNGQTVNLAYGFVTANAATRVLTLGASTINVTNNQTGSSVAWSWSGTNVTLNENTSVIKFATTCNFTGGAETYYEVQFNGTAHNIVGANSFTNLTRTGTATKTDSLTLYANQTITGTLTINGNSKTNRLLIQSDTPATQRTLTAATVVVSNADFIDIVGAGAGDWALTTEAESAGDLGNNSGITFTTAQTNYYVGNSGNWSDVGHWTTATDGTGGGTGRVPLPQDTARFNAYSITIASRTVTVDMPRLGNINAVGVLNTPTLSGFTSSIGNIYGDVTLGGSGTIVWSGNTYFYGRGTQTLNFNSSTITGDVYTFNHSSTLELSSDIVATGTIYLRAGTLSFGAFDVTAGYFDSSTTTYTRILSLGSGTLTLNGTAAGTKWNINVTSFTFVDNTATIILTNSTANGQTFAGAGLTNYNNISVAGAGNYTLTITGNNTFNVFYVDRSSAAKTISGAVTCTIANLSIPVSSTTVVTITNTDFTKTSGTVVSDYLTISGSNAGGGASYFAGAHSTDSGGNAGWVFTDAADPVVSSLAATGIGNNDATLNGNIDSMGGETSIFVYFEYGTTIAYGTTTTEQPKSAVSTFTQDIHGLAQGTTYHYRAVARYAGTTYVYGADMSLTTTAPTGAPTALTASASDITTTTATLNGSLVDLGLYTTVYASFEYGTTTSYGSSTGEQTLTALDNFTYDITGLLYGQTYHFRARVRYVSGATSYYANGGDVTFDTLSAPGQSTTLSIVSAAAFIDYLEDGDLLITAEVKNTYTGYYPKKDPKQYFQIQLLNALGTSILGATPLWSWGDVPVSIYFNDFQVSGGKLTNGTGTATYTSGLAYKLLDGATTVTITATGTFTIVLPPGDGGTAVGGTATLAGSPVTLVAGSNTINVTAIPGGGGTIIVTPNNLVEDSAYIVRMIGLFTGNPSTTYTLAATDWKGDDLDKLDQWMIGVAFNINSYDSATSWWRVSKDTISVDTDNNIRLSDYGGGYFTGGIPAISSVRPNIFAALKDKPLLTITTATNVYDNQTWVSAETYALNDRVGYNGVVYRCIAGGVTTLPDTPATDAAHWVATAETLWKVQVGTKLANDMDALGDLFAIDGDEFLGFGIVILIIFITCLGMMAGGKALPLLILNFPLLMWGNQMRVIGITFTIVIAIMMAFLFIRAFYAKST